MAKSILVIVAILAISTSGALAAQRIHHGRASPAPAPSEWSRGPSPYAVGPGSSNVRDLYIKNLRDSGYNPENNFNRFGNVQAVPYGGG
ncbi:hypothetical protein M2202_005216 [Bradyrhizobium japonicum]|jgi:hypothetical protein|nr:hypothetical protein [Bradyrhizobium japonicum]BAL10425.1 hypothetical protein BJ6T_51640 [Bradyrhizobium japonicum USDA 6]MCP1788111.1 hypothetical protein [Bradyrhizobium japonicum]MCP1809987.1 hypothetical protein [Bradyrhizobium japonicum]MCP1818921.1 hypothetical protein [Bradyrhizobium japonicum]